MDHSPRLGKRELICLLLFTCNNVVSVRRGFLSLWVLGMGYVILLWHSLSLPYNYIACSWQSVRYELAISCSIKIVHDKDLQTQGIQRFLNFAYMATTASF